jgi:hypothetical protein
MQQHALWLIIAMSLFVAASTTAQMAEDSSSTNATSILSALPPDLYAKLQKLSVIVDQNIKAGRLTDVQIQQQLMSGQLEQTIRSLSPEANQLFEEITTDMRNGKGPSEDAMMSLLGGLTGSGK